MSLNIKWPQICKKRENRFEDVNAQKKRKDIFPGQVSYSANKRAV